MKRLILLGAPGVGKGTYANLLCKKHNLALISLGDVIRGEIKAQTDLGREFQNFSNSGKLVPDELVISLVKRELSNLPASKGVVFDGFPRTIAQAEALENLIDMDTVLNLQMNENFLISKILGRRMCSNPTCKKNFNVTYVRCDKDHVDMPPLLPKNGSHETCDCGSKLIKRADDVLDVIKNRLKVYENETMPLIDFYAEKGILKTLTIKKGLKDFPKIIHLLGFSSSTKSKSTNQQQLNLSRL